jgi:hypothetical protein
MNLCVYSRAFWICAVFLSVNFIPVGTFFLLPGIYFELVEFTLESLIGQALFWYIISTFVCLRMSLFLPCPHVFNEQLCWIWYSWVTRFFFFSFHTMQCHASLWSPVRFLLKSAARQIEIPWHVLLCSYTRNQYFLLFETFCILTCFKSVYFNLLKNF